MRGFRLHVATRNAVGSRHIGQGNVFSENLRSSRCQLVSLS